MVQKREADETESYEITDAQEAVFEALEVE